MRVRLLLLVVASMLVPACQLRLGTDVTVGADGSGQLELRVALDRELTRLLTDAGVDPLEGLEEARRLAPDWSVEVSRREGTEATLRASFAEPSGLADLAEGLHAALDPADGALFRDLALMVEDSGAARFSGRVGLLLPDSPGAEGEGVRFDMDDVRRLIRDSGENLVAYEFRVTLPAAPESHDADRVSGRTLTWRAPVGSLREVSAASPAPGGTEPVVAVAVALLSAAVAALALVLLRRRRARPPPGPASTR